MDKAIIRAPTTLPAAHSSQQHTVHDDDESGGRSRQANILTQGTSHAEEALRGARTGGSVWGACAAGGVDCGREAKLRVAEVVHLGKETSFGLGKVRVELLG